MEVDKITRLLAYVVAGDVQRRRYTSVWKLHQGPSRLIPTFEMLNQETFKCYPADDDLTITENSAKVKLQALMDLTSKRLIGSLATSTIESNQQFVLTSQWGFDRSSSLSIYHGETPNFMISVVHRRLVSNGVTIWKNELPSSLSFCRPLLFKFMNDTKENVQAELAIVEAEIEALTPTTLPNGITVTHQMILTLFDEEYQSITSDTVASVCQICKANAIKTNPHLESVKWKLANRDVNKYGLSSLHTWVRSMQSLLEISYKLDIKSWQPYSSEAKKQANMRRELILGALKNTNYVFDPSDQSDQSIYRGRSAHGFFELCKSYSQLTKLDYELLRQICVVLQCISSGRKIIVPRFREFCLDVAKRYTRLYPWYYMPSPLHKLLIHGPDFVENLSIIPIGMLCEGITEDTDNRFWMYRENAVMFCSSSWNKKYLLRLLLVSDPVLASIYSKVNNSTFKEYFSLTGIEQKDLYKGPRHCDYLSVLTSSEDEDDDF